MLATFAFAGVAASIAPWVLPPKVRTAGVAALVWVSCLAALTLGVRVLASGDAVSWSSSQLLPLAGVSVRLTSLGALFVVTSALVALAATLYWLGYAHHGLSSRSGASALALFVASMLAVPMAESVTTFLVLWELMALSSLVLVANDHARREAARSAAQWYAVMTHLGAGAILAGFVLVAAHSHGQDFTSLAHAHLSSATRSVAFLLFVVGFASKAGAVPLHVWLPKAHAEAPGPASALMSGAMVNLGIYGVILTGRVLLGGGPSWWWIVVGALGIVSALYGALYAATSTDVKRLLAYSTSDNMGLVLLAVGASGLFNASGQAKVGALAMASALVLLINHAAFKSTLFLASASIQVATGTRDLDRLGGLMRTMPVTGPVFLVGALSVAALPPFNGFVSEWMLFQSLLHAIPSPTTQVVVMVALGVATLALTGGLTVVAFVKASGIGLLGRARSDEAAQAHEVPASMRWGSGLLAGACLVLGVAPLLELRAVDRAMGGLGTASLAGGGWSVLHLGAFRGELAPALVGAALVLGVLVVTLVRRVRRARAWSVLRASEPWGSGREVQTARMQYTATSFAEPLQRVFDDVVRPERDLDVDHAAESRYYIERIRLRSANVDLVERALYRPLQRGLAWWGERARVLQNGSVHRYLAYGLVALVVVLVVVA